MPRKSPPQLGEFESTKTNIPQHRRAPLTCSVIARSVARKYLSTEGTCSPTRAPRCSLSLPIGPDPRGRCRRRWVAAGSRGTPTIRASCSPISPSRSPTVRTFCRTWQRFARTPSSSALLPRSRPPGVRSRRRPRSSFERSRPRSPLQARRSGRISTGTLAHARLRRNAAHRLFRGARRRANLQEGLRLPPLGVWCDTTAEPLAAMLRPSNAGSNDADDHLRLLDQATAALPVDY